VGDRDPDLVWDIVDYVPLKKMVVAPGGRGVVGLSEDGFAIYFRGYGSARKPRISLVEMNSALNLVQDIAAGPTDASFAPSLAVVTAADPDFSKPSQLYVISESLGDAAAENRPIRLRHSSGTRTAFEIRGVQSNFQEMSVATLQKAIAELQTPLRIRPRAILELVAELAKSADPCRTLLSFRRVN
jgi:hypothetical protein